MKNLTGNIFGRLSEWAEIFGIKPKVVYCRIYRGMSEIEALKKPLRIKAYS